VFDEDIGKDDKLGEVKISLSEVLNEGTSNKWYQLEQCKSGEVLVATKLVSKESAKWHVKENITTHYQGINVEKKLDADDLQSTESIDTTKSTNKETNKKDSQHTHICKDEPNKTVTHFHEEEIVKVRACDDEDRFKRTSTQTSEVPDNLLNNQTNIKAKNIQEKYIKTELVKPEILNAANETVSNIINSAKDKIAAINKNEKQTNEEDNKRKDEVEKIISEFLVSDEEENEDESINHDNLTQTDYKKDHIVNVVDKSKLEVTKDSSNLQKEDPVEDYEGAQGLRILLKKDNLADQIKSKNLDQESQSEQKEVITKSEKLSTFVHAVGPLKLKVIKAKNLKNMDLVGKSDPYVNIQYGKKVLKSKKKKNTLNPEWNWETEIELDEHEPGLLLTIFDSDKFGKDDKMGSLEIPTKKLQISNQIVTYG